MASGFEREFKDTFQEPINEIKKSAQEFTDLTHDFGKVDTEPSPPMSAERSTAPPEVIDSTVPQVEQPELQSEDVTPIEDTGEPR
jgi:hypothetical protein